MKQCDNCGWFLPKECPALRSTPVELDGLCRKAKDHNGLFVVVSDHGENVQLEVRGGFRCLSWLPITYVDKDHPLNKENNHG